jgi:hypothetical protein
VVSGRRKPETVAEHIAAYRNSLAHESAKEAPPAEDDIPDDVFADMMPEVRKQKKVYVGPNEEKAFSRLSVQESFTPEAPPVRSGFSICS